MAATIDFRVRQASADDTTAILATLSDGYGRAFTEEWFDWKHRQSPWGASIPQIAEDEDGILGVAFRMPWRSHLDGEVFGTSRLVDGTTVPRAARRGVFRAVVSAMLQEGAVSQVAPSMISLATATPEAQGAHVKNGAVALDPVVSAYRPIRPIPARVEDRVDLLGSYEFPRRPGSVTTAWTAEAVKWRVGLGSGSQYTVSRLANSDRNHGLIHRTVSQKGLRALVVTAHWGAPAEVQRLVRAVGWRERAVTMLSPVGPGAIDPFPRVSLRRGASLLCVWDQRPPASGPAIAERARWSLDGLDIEGVV